MWTEILEATNQVFGISGLIAVIVQFIYTLTNAANFTSFELFFFVLTSSTDIGTEVFLLYHGLKILRKFGFSLKLLRALIKDPAHILAATKINGDTTNELKQLQFWALLTLFGSNSSVYIWATTYPLWGFSGDAGFRLALSIVSFALVLPFIYVCAFAKHLGNVLDFGSTRFTLFFSLASLMYIMEKAFELFIMFSNEERLISGFIGIILVTVLSTEIFSISSFLLYLWIPEINIFVNTTEEQDALQGDLLRQRTEMTADATTPL